MLRRVSNRLASIPGEHIYVYTLMDGLLQPGFGVMPCEQIPLEMK